ncbi:hypothetical protein FRB90_010992 [Tulasnella sp. 427]|nr:hypothetical protein FRB90_010992 [Tulasnella sp. 427]
MVQPGNYRIRNAKSGTYLDESNKNADQVHGWDSRPDNQNQKWTLEQANQGFTIKNLGHGRYLAPSSSDDGAEVTALDNPFEWELREENGAYAITIPGSQQVVDLDRGHDENGTPVSIWGFHGASQQLWQLEEEGGYQGGQQQPQYQGPISPGTYRVHNVFTGTALDLAGGKSDDGTPVIAWSVGNGPNQAWTFESGSKGYRVKNNASGTYLGCGSLNEGELLAGHSQPVEWTVTQDDEGYQLHPAENPQLVIDLAEGKKDDGAKICIWSNKQGQNQKWLIQQA